MAIDVVADVYSGRPNPSWRLSESAEALWRRAMAETSTGTPESAPPLPKLGYRGLRVLDGDRETVVLGGFLRNATGTRVDSGRRLERWLIGTAADTLTPDALETLEALSGLRVS